jgi:hypothetical protein
MNCSRRVYSSGLIFAALLLGAAGARGQGLVDRGPELKASVVAVLSRTVSWPADIAPGAQTPLKVGVLGQDPFQQGGIDHLDRELKKRLSGRQFTIQRFADIDAYQPVHILVIAQAADQQAAVKKTQGQPVLLIAQAPGLARQGAIINLLVVQNRLKMEINLDAAKRAGLRIDSRVLRLPSVEIVQ